MLLFDKETERMYLFWFRNGVIKSKWRIRCRTMLVPKILNKGLLSGKNNKINLTENQWGLEVDGGEYTPT